MTSYFEKTKDEDIGLLLSGFMISTNHDDWKKDIQVWDEATWEDWMLGVYATLQGKHLIQMDPLSVMYTEEMAFLCMKNYLNILYREVKFEGVKNILRIINTVDIGNVHDTSWLFWLECVQAAIDQEDNIVA